MIFGCKHNNQHWCMFCDDFNMVESISKDKSFTHVGIVFYLHKIKLSPWEESKETFMFAKKFPKKDDFNCILATLKAILLMGLPFSFFKKRWFWLNFGELKKMHVFKDWVVRIIDKLIFHLWFWVVFDSNPIWVLCYCTLPMTINYFIFSYGFQ